MLRFRCYKVYAFIPLLFKKLLKIIRGLLSEINKDHRTTNKNTKTLNKIKKIIT